MIDRTGILKNSPLIYTLASIRFASWPLMAKKIDEIHDELRDITPLINRIQVQKIGVDGQALTQGEDATLKAWMLMSSDRSHGIQLSPDQLLFFSSKYSHYADFEKILAKGLEVLLKHMRFMDVTNMGARYVDHIKVRDGEQPKDYISEGLLPATFARLERVGGITMGVYKSGEAELRVHCISQPVALTVPEDLIGVLAMIQEPGRPLKLEALKKGEMLLDMDAIKSNSEPQRLDKQAILNQLKSLHQVANAFFRHESVCTEYAFKVWKGEE